MITRICVGPWGTATCIWWGIEFPRVTRNELRPGVSGVRYSISLPECAQFETSIDSLASAVGGKTIWNAD